MSRTPLSVLDLVPVSSGASGADAVRNAISLAQATESFGYHRYWVAEHHLNPGVASASTPVLVALLAAATDRIRVGSGAVQLPHTPPLLVAEQFGTVAAVHPGRIDLGLGRFDLHTLLRIIREAAGPGGPALYAQWVLDIRTGRGAHPYVTPAQARARVWTDQERAVVADRVDTQFVGAPATVVERLATLARVTGADELLVTTITTAHADRVRSTELLAAAWTEHAARAA